MKCRSSCRHRPALGTARRRRNRAFLSATTDKRWKVFVTIAIIAFGAASYCDIVVQASSFPGKMKHPQPVQNYWQEATESKEYSSTKDDNDNQNHALSSSNSSDDDDDDEGRDDTESSSSEWEWDDTDLMESLEEEKARVEEAEQEEDEEVDEEEEDEDEDEESLQDEAVSNDQTSTQSNEKPPLSVSVASSSAAVTSAGTETVEAPATDKVEDTQKPPQNNKPPSLPTKAKKTTPVVARQPQRRGSPSATSSSSKPLKTLEKLQQMLDETDYIIEGRRRNEAASYYSDDDSVATDDGFDDDFSLWTSKDRSKYKKQQKLQAATQQQEQHQQQPQESSNFQQQSLKQQPGQHYYPYPDPHRLHEYQQQRIQEQRILRQQQQQYQYQQQQHIDTSMSSDADDVSDTDDGLGYTLPNLPVYLSDAEGESETDSEAATTITQTPPPPPPPPKNVAEGSSNANAASQGAFPPNRAVYPENQWYGHPPLQPPPDGYYYPPGYDMPYPSYYHPAANTKPPADRANSPPQKQEQQQQNSYGPYSQPPYYPRPPRGSAYRPPPRPYVPRRLESTVSATATRNPRRRYSQTMVSSTRAYPNTESDTTPTSDGLEVTQQLEIHNPNQPTLPVLSFNLGSVLKLATCILLSTIVCYAAVSPSTLPYLEYNAKFYEILRTASLTVVIPSLIFLLVVDMNNAIIPRNDPNELMSAFFWMFTVGYAGCFLAQVVSATFIRLAAFSIWEPNVFQLAPQIPLPVIPWVLREQNYRPKRITLLAQDFVTSCVVAPILEEMAKLIMLRKTVSLPKNFNWVTKRSKNKKKKRIAEVITNDGIDNKDVTNVNKYVSSMLAVTLGLKLADSIRRVCMYTKASHEDKIFYALFRGLFPIQELCGTATALGLARRDVLGQETPLWMMLFPASFIHGMANFRGMKPIFKWNSANPWVEMQLSPNFTTEGLTFTQLAGIVLPKLLWLIIIFRVAGYCIKNYYMINRQAVRRTTTYAGKPSAFSAELEATKALKDKKNKQAARNA